jgi:PAS domain S-box-containing protein
MSSRKNQPEIHQEIMEWVSEEYRPILDGSPQGVYVYLDDTHKLANGKFAKMLGYGSAEELSKLDVPWIDAFVAEESADQLVGNYTRAMEEKVGSSFAITWKRKGGGRVRTNVILVPISYRGQDMALHFVTPIKE